MLGELVEIPRGDADWNFRRLGLFPNVDFRTLYLEFYNTIHIVGVGVTESSTRIVNKCSYPA